MKSLISITPRAVKQLSNILKGTNKKAIYFDIKSGGCNGFEYRFKAVDKVINKENTYKKDNLEVEICDKSLMFILGTEIDWNEDIMGRAFTFKNPLAQSSCGCGSSFNPK